MKANMPKKKWKRPKLIILIRGKPQERVLVGCKTGSSTNAGFVWPGVCGGVEVGGEGPCADCSDIASS